MTDEPITNCTITNCNIYSTDSTTRYDIAPSGKYDTSTCTATSITHTNTKLIVSGAVVPNGTQGYSLTVIPTGQIGAIISADSNNKIVHNATVVNTINGVVQTSVDITSLDKMPTDVVGQYTSVITFKVGTDSATAVTSNTYVVTPEHGSLYYKLNGTWKKVISV